MTDAKKDIDWTKSFSKREKTFVDIVKSRIEHCSTQVDALKNGDPDTAREWLVRQMEAELILEQFKSASKIGYRAED